MKVSDAVSKAGSVTTISTVTTALGDDKSLKGFDNVDDDFANDMKRTFQGFNPQDCEMWIVSVPKDFPVDKLKNIPLDPEVAAPLEVLGSDGNRTSYLCDHVTNDSNTTKAIVIPNNSSQAKYHCSLISNSIRVREDITTSSSSVKHFLPRPPAPTMSAGLIERWKPIGWDSPAQFLKTQTKRKAQSEFTTSPKKKIKNSPIKNDVDVESMLDELEIVDKVKKLPKTKRKHKKRKVKRKEETKSKKVKKETKSKKVKKDKSESKKIKKEVLT